MYSFLKAFLLLMKLLSLSQFYAPKKILKRSKILIGNYVPILGISGKKLIITLQNLQMLFMLLF